MDKGPEVMDFGRRRYHSHKLNHLIMKRFALLIAPLSPRHQRDKGPTKYTFRGPRMHGSAPLRSSFFCSPASQAYQNIY